jgi:hypothetical protein
LLPESLCSVNGVVLHPTTQSFRSTLINGWFCFSLLCCILNPGFAKEVHVTDCSITSIPCDVKKALSPAFVDEWGVAIDHYNAGFIKHSCFKQVYLPKNAKVLPGIWEFTCKQDHSAQATSRLISFYSIWGAQTYERHLWSPSPSGSF